VGEKNKQDKCRELARRGVSNKEEKAKEPNIYKRRKTPGERERERERKDTHTHTHKRERDPDKKKRNRIACLHSQQFGAFASFSFVLPSIHPCLFGSECVYVFVSLSCPLYIHA
jgi:hypothetical protein